MTKRERLAYLAGAIDSDGTIGVKKSTYAMRVTGDSSQPVYSERVAFRQVTAHIVEMLHVEFGGSAYMTKPSAEHGRALFSWAVTDQKAATCITALRPFLRVKGEQARNVLALRRLKDASKKRRVAVGRGHAGSAPRAARFSDGMDACYLRAKALNAVGA